MLKLKKENRSLWIGLWIGIAAIVVLCGVWGLALGLLVGHYHIGDGHAGEIDVAQHHATAAKNIYAVYYDGLTVDVYRAKDEAPTFNARVYKGERSDAFFNTGDTQVLIRTGVVEITDRGEVGKIFVKDGAKLRLTLFRDKGESDPEIEGEVEITRYPQ